MGCSLGNDEVCFSSFKVKGAVEHSEGEVEWQCDMWLCSFGGRQGR